MWECSKGLASTGTFTSMSTETQARCQYLLKVDWLLGLRSFPRFPGSKSYIARSRKDIYSNMHVARSALTVQFSIWYNSPSGFNCLDKSCVLILLPYLLLDQFSPLSNRCHFPYSCFHVEPLLLYRQLSNVFLAKSWFLPLIFLIDFPFLCRLRSIAAHRDHFVRRLSVCACVRACVCLSDSHTFLIVTLVNTIETKPLHISLSNLQDMLTVMRGCTLLIL